MRTAPETARALERPAAAGEYVILVDANDVQCGVAEKLAAHRLGLRHRAFSVFVFHDDGRLLLQRRAASKYHSAGRWTNTCCGHPRPHESTIEAARRRLREEMGLEAELVHAATFEYRALLEDGMIEHEIDHVLVGRCARDPRPDPAEAAAWRWSDARAALADARLFPELYTAWFAPALSRLAAGPALRTLGR